MRSPTPRSALAACVASLGCCLAAALLAPAPVRAAVERFHTSGGIIDLFVNNLGYIGNGFDFGSRPSCEYPRGSYIEHVFLGGIWVGAVTADGTIRVSTAAQDVANLADGDAIREFADIPGEAARVWSNRQNADNYHPLARATEHIELVFSDNATNHQPLGLRVLLRVLSWGNSYADDFVVLDYSLINASNSALRDVYIGLWSDTTIGNTQNTDPYDPNAAVRWNYYDDSNGAWGPSGDVADRLGLPPGHIPDGSQVQDDPGIWMNYEHDADGDEGLATTWVGGRLLGTDPAAEPAAGVPPVSYNAWTFRNVPGEDTWYRQFEIADGETVWTDYPGKYQLMSNGAFTVGQTQAEDYTIPTDWVTLLSTGPFPYIAPNDTIRFTYAIVCGQDSLSLLANGKAAQLAYEDGFSLPSGPPSPRLADVRYDWNRVILQWAPGDSVSEGGLTLAADDPRRSPEHHISTSTGKPDFQGYRILRFRGEDLPAGDPYEVAELVAEYDKVDGYFGFDTGLPPLNAQGLREFTVDSSLLDGFPYWYSVLSFSAPDLEEGLPSFQSGFFENAVKVYPGPASTPIAGAGKVGVAPNPYLGSSFYDAQTQDPETGRKIWFTNLPPRCTVKVYTVAGDLVRTLSHDDRQEGKIAWDVLNEYGRAIASGLYVYAVEDLESAEIERGKLVIIK